MQATERQAEVGEFTVNYGFAGKGEPLLLIHGSDRREDWHVWEPVLQLADAYSLYMPDLVGYGRSSRSAETPDYRAQAGVLKDFLEKLAVPRANVAGAGWGGQVALQLALDSPSSVRSLVLVAGTYDVAQLRKLKDLRKPTLIVYAEDDMVTQLKAGYALRDAIGTSRLEVLDAVARDPRYGFTVSHRLEKYRAPQVAQLVRLFLSKPEQMVTLPPETEEELKGMAMRKEAGPSSSGTP